MMSSIAVSKLRPSVQRLVASHATRSMSVLSKQSYDEYKKLVSRERSKALGAENAILSSYLCTTVH